MNIHRVLLFCFLLALCGGSSRCVDAQTTTFIGTEGQSVRVKCDFSLSGSRTLFCKGKCSTNNILIETTADTAHNNKYSIEYFGSWNSRGTLFVTIRQLTKSDEGQYRCSTSSLFEDYMDIFLVVKDAATTSSTRSTPSVTFPEATTQLADFFLPLVICVPAIVLLLAVVLLLLYKQKTKRNLDNLHPRGNLDDRNMEISPYEIYPPLSTCEGSIYQKLDPASRDQDQVYSTLT